jgi:RND family efflux transporter MFP subunit
MIIRIHTGNGALMIDDQPPPEAQQPQNKRLRTESSYENPMTIKTWMQELAILAAVLGVASTGCTPTKNDYVPPPPPEVTVAKPLRAPVRLIMEKTGNTEAVEEAVVSSRVRGFIESIPFKPGQEVALDDLLYEIERDEYQAIKDSAEAALSSATAAIAVAEGRVATVNAEVLRAGRDFERQKVLKQQNATSASEYDTAQAAMEAADANLISVKAAVQAAKASQQQAEAELVQAQQDLDYTKVRASIPGRISKTEVKLGNLVENGQALATIVNSDQVFANFTVSDREALRLQKMDSETHPDRAKLEQKDWSEFQVFLRRETDDTFRFQGHINYVDQRGIDPDTGTLGLRAIFENPDDLLLQGMFVHLRIPFGDDVNSLLVPEFALSRNNQGSFVLLVGDEQKVEQRSVTIGAKLDGWAVVRTGLTEDDVVIVQGLQRARPGAEVNPVMTTLKAEESSFIGGQNTGNANTGDAPGESAGGDPAAKEPNGDAAKAAPGDSSKSGNRSDL